MLITLLLSDQFTSGLICIYIVDDDTKFYMNENEKFCYMRFLRNAKIAAISLFDNMIKYAVWYDNT